MKFESPRFAIPLEKNWGKINELAVNRQPIDSFKALIYQNDPADGKAKHFATIEGTNCRIAEATSRMAEKDIDGDGTPDNILEIAFWAEEMAWTCVNGTAGTCKFSEAGE